MNTLQEVQRVDTAALKKFAQAARRKLREQVAAQLDRVLKNDSAELREKEVAIKELTNQIAISSREIVIDRVSYTWFNRFCALRFMDVNQYTRIGTVSPAEGFTQPEILAEAKQGHIDESLQPFIGEQRVFDLLSGRITSKDPQQEAYRRLIVAVCNYYNSIMPFLFEKIADYSELLMPDDLLSDSSVLADTRNTLTKEVCRDVEVIGWLYQFYISEKKDEIFADLKKNKKISPENIPAATQLFTPHWIVRYLVENSLGRLWMLNRPKSRLIDRMDFCILPDQQCTNFLRINKPEELRICDPACGSGHMLVYAFDLLYAIYEEEGYEPTDIPHLILQNNLYGIEIDERAGELAAFALVMKARGKYRRFFVKPVQPNICILENIEFQNAELKPYMDAVGHNLFTESLQNTLNQFRESNNFGSLIRPTVTDTSTLRQLLESKNIGGNIFLHKTHDKVLRVLRYADFLAAKYHVVIANPPYMGNRGLNERLATWLKDNYTDAKSDLFAAFIIRNTELALPHGQLGFMSPFVWMFIATYEPLRKFLLRNKTITSLVQLEYSGFDGATVPICTFTLENYPSPDYLGSYVRLSDFKGSENQAPRTLEAIKNPNCPWFYKVPAVDFQKIPGSPIAYWVSNKFRETFQKGQPLDSIAPARLGMTSSDNSRFVRYWYEVDFDKIGFNFSTEKEAISSGKKWFPYNKGGDYRKWFGNNLFVINWANGGKEVLQYAAELYGSPTRTIRNIGFYFKPAITWSFVSSSSFGVRANNQGFIFDVAGSSAFPPEGDKWYILALLVSRLAFEYLKTVNPTLNFQAGNVGSIPVIKPTGAQKQTIDANARSATQIVKTDWDASEISWDFSSITILNSRFRRSTLASTYAALRDQWRNDTLALQRLQQENNETLIEAYGLVNDVNSSVDLTDVTLSCNPTYRYGQGKSEEELEELLLSDTIKEFLSYFVGCAFGRYSLDRPGLILVGQHKTKHDYYEQVPDPTFPIDDDNVIPILDGDWFNDDISDRFRKFLRTVFGEQHYQENLQFIQKILGKDVRKYFLKDFYNDHIKRYKKRPIYWLFSSPKGTFNALVYIHRYRPDTLSVVLNDYLREFRNKLSSRKTHLEAVSISANVAPAEKTKALKEIESLKKTIDELDAYERDVLYPLATRKIDIDLDDGVRVNYSKFDKALKAIPGMASEED